MRGKSFLRPAVLGAGLAALLAFGSGCGQKSEAAGSSPVSEAGKGAETEAGREETAVSDAVEWSDMTVSGSMDLTYAEQFSVDYYDGGYALIAIDSSGKYLTVPEGCPVPAGLPEDYMERFGVSYQHILQIDQHRPWTDPAILPVLEQIEPRYLTHELSSRGRMARAEAVSIQTRLLRQGGRMRV